MSATPHPGLECMSVSSQSRADLVPGIGARGMRRNHSDPFQAVERQVWLSGRNGRSLSRFCAIRDAQITGTRCKASRTRQNRRKGFRHIKYRVRYENASCVTLGGFSNFDAI